MPDYAVVVDVFFAVGGAIATVVLGLATAVFAGWAIAQQWAHHARPRWYPVRMTGIWRSDSETHRSLRIEVANLGDAAAYDVRLESRRPNVDGKWRIDGHWIKVDSGAVVTWQGGLSPRPMPNAVADRYWSGVGVYFDMSGLGLRVTWRHRPGFSRKRTVEWLDMEAIQPELYPSEEVDPWPLASPPPPPASAN